jgi:hypothetical protein
MDAEFLEAAARNSPGSRRRRLPFSTEWQNAEGGSTTAAGCSFVPLTHAFAHGRFRSYLGVPAHIWGQRGEQDRPIAGNVRRCAARKAANHPTCPTTTRRAFRGRWPCGARIRPMVRPREVATRSDGRHPLPTPVFQDRPALIQHSSNTVIVDTRPRQRQTLGAVSPGAAHSPAAYLAVIRQFEEAATPEADIGSSACAAG